LPKEDDGGMEGTEEINPKELWSDKFQENYTEIE
jgi:hypothetical protein